MRPQVLLGLDGMEILLSLVGRVLLDLDFTHVPSESTTAVGHSDWSSILLNPLRLAIMLHHLRFLGAWYKASQSGHKYSWGVITWEAF